jgi:hypothetical protein
MFSALRRHLTAAVPTLVALVVGGALTAVSAATLGGLDSTSLGAGQNATASCNTTGIALAYTNVYNAASNDYQTTAVTMSGVNAVCSGRAFQLTLSDGVAVLATKTGTVALVTGSQTVTLTTPVSARAVTGASLVITG